jgi:hypothetical protein
MGLFSSLFSSRGDDDDSSSVRVREKNSDRSVVRGDKITSTGDGKHTHDSYSLDRTTGSYKEYRGGENSSERSYNKESSGDSKK